MFEKNTLYECHIDGVILMWAQNLKCQKEETYYIVPMTRGLQIYQVPPPILPPILKNTGNLQLYLGIF